MTRVTATEFKNNIGAFSDAAMTEPVIITSHQRDRLVLISAEEYRRLTDEQSNLPHNDRRSQIRERAEYHRATIVDLANR
ncbi:MAG: type II toxin-antitoxin system prevent-host-death family antitoxin [Pseudomonadota bacterium]